MDDNTQNRLPRHAKGKRPKFYTVDGLDEAMSMILVLAGEFSVMRDRLETVELIAAQKNIILDKEIENFEPDEATMLNREQRRKSLLDRLYYLTLKKAEEQKNDDSAERYSSVLDDIAKS